MDPSLVPMGLALSLVLQASILATQVALLAIGARSIGARGPDTPYVDVSLTERSGAFAEGRWAVAGGLDADQPVSPSGVIALEVASDALWVFEVWARTDHGWVQLQPGRRTAPDGTRHADPTFRNTLVAGVRLSALRLWMAPIGEEPDESGLRAAAGLLVPAALLLTRASTATSRTPSEARPRSLANEGRSPILE